MNLQRNDYEELDHPSSTKKTIPSVQCSHGNNKILGLGGYAKKDLLPPPNEEGIFRIAA
jgi:hypothetical protein